MFERENLIGVALLVLCGAVAAVLLYSIGTGTRFRFEGPGWVGTALLLFFIGATIYLFIRTPGRRWPWDWWRDRKRDDQ
jgi:drug/metabolite transporter (DMT)-like permease